ncbi:hypothetical protein GCM10010964_43540 [Caldovatus sediminis]|uniref:Uncharacterized protein n=1 Tax=Caldovatus sediminis TaxID=2041189 RepID=A0A8J2ZFX4_9PROT|nr:hypothetical protein [Caldovatus sediminis]GGG51641.1 hypothetical protein GCM10010964_43540 [Caldovatus sediminis]
MTPDVLAWALAQPPGSRGHALAAAYLNGTSRVTFEGRTVEYRSIRDIAAALEALFGAANAAPRRPAVTVAVVGDGFR